MFRFSVATLFLLILIAGIGSAALVNANDLWRQVIITLTVVVLVVATLAAGVRQGRSRAFSLGFAVSGWIYLLLVFVSAFGLRDDLLTDKTVRLIFAAIHEEDLPQKQLIQGITFTSDAQYLVTAGEDKAVRIWNATTGRAVNKGTVKVNFKDFADIGHSFWVIIVACLGGVVACLMAAKQRDRS